MQTTRDYLLGIALLLVVVLLWTVSNFVTQALFINGYHKPFLVTYLNTSSFTLYLIPFLCHHVFRHFRHEQSKYATIPTTSDENVDVSPASITPHTPLTGPRSNEYLPPLTTMETARLAAIFCLFWFVANWTMNASLDYTQVASATILSSTSGFFTLGIGRIFRVESLTPTKVAAVITSFLGILLVSLSDSRMKGEMINSPDLPASPVALTALFGDILALLSALFYALYVILLKVRIGSESRIDMQLFFGFVGAFNTIALIPVGIMLHITGYERFHLPSTDKEWGAVLLNMFITLSSDYIYVLSMLKTTPLVVTIGLSLTIPLAIVGDQLLSIPTRGQAILGGIMVLASFGLINWKNRNPGAELPIEEFEAVDSSISDGQ